MKNLLKSRGYVKSLISMTKLKPFDDWLTFHEMSLERYHHFLYIFH